MNISAHNAAAASNHAEKIAEPIKVVRVTPARPAPSAECVPQPEVAEVVPVIPPDAVVAPQQLEHEEEPEPQAQDEAHDVAAEEEEEEDDSQTKQDAPQPDTAAAARSPTPEAREEQLVPVQEAGNCEAEKCIECVEQEEPHDQPAQVHEEAHQEQVALEPQPEPEEEKAVPVREIVETVQIEPPEEVAVPQATPCGEESVEEAPQQKQQAEGVQTIELPPLDPSPKVSRDSYQTIKFELPEEKLQVQRKFTQAKKASSQAQQKWLAQLEEMKSRIQQQEKEDMRVQEDAELRRQQALLREREEHKLRLRRIRERNEQLMSQTHAVKDPNPKRGIRYDPQEVALEKLSRDQNYYSRYVDTHSKPMSLQELKKTKPQLFYGNPQGKIGYRRRVGKLIAAQEATDRTQSAAVVVAGEPIQVETQCPQSAGIGGEAGNLRGGHEIGEGERREGEVANAAQKEAREVSPLQESAQGPQSRNE